MRSLWAAADWPDRESSRRREDKALYNGADLFGVMSRIEWNVGKKKGARQFSIEKVANVEVQMKKNVNSEMSDMVHRVKNRKYSSYDRNYRRRSGQLRRDSIGCRKCLWANWEAIESENRLWRGRRSCFWSSWESDQWKTTRNTSAKSKRRRRQRSRQCRRCRLKSFRYT